MFLFFLEILENTIFLTIIHSGLFKSIELHNFLHICKYILFILYMARVIRFSLWEFFPNK